MFRVATGRETTHLPIERLKNLNYTLNRVYLNLFNLLNLIETLLWRFETFLFKNRDFLHWKVGLSVAHPAFSISINPIGSIVSLGRLCSATSP